MLLESEAPTRQKVNPVLKLLLEMGPLCVFFVANLRPEWFRPLVEAILPVSMFQGDSGGIFIATSVFIPITVLAMAAGLIIMRRIPIMPLASGIFVIVFAGTDSASWGSLHRGHRDDCVPGRDG